MTFSSIKRDFSIHKSSISFHQRCVARPEIPCFVGVKPRRRPRATDLPRAPRRAPPAAGDGSLAEGYGSDIVSSIELISCGSEGWGLPWSQCIEIVGWELALPHSIARTRMGACHTYLRRIALRINEVQQTVGMGTGAGAGSGRGLHDQMIEQALANLQQFMRKP